MAGESPKVINCFQTKAGIHACELHLIAGLLNIYCAFNYAL